MLGNTAIATSNNKEGYSVIIDQINYINICNPNYIYLCI
jgi:hypothetical protein